MTRQEIIQKIVEIRPQIASAEQLVGLTDQELQNLLQQNEYLKHYKLLMKQQMIMVITYIYGERYSKLYLFTKSFEEVERIYLEARQITRSEYDNECSDKLAAFIENAQREGNEEYLTFTEDELIIASGAIIPEFLLTEEEYTSESLLKRIDEIATEIKELESIIELNEGLIADGDADNDLVSEIVGCKNKINRLRDDMKRLMFPGSDLPEKRMRK